MKTVPIAAALTFGLSLLAFGREPVRFDELSLLVRMREPDFVIVRQVSSRRLHRPLTPEQVATLKSQGASDAILQKLKDPEIAVGEPEAMAADARRENQEKGQQTETAAKAAAPGSAQLTKEDFRVLNVPFGEPVSLRLLVGRELGTVATGPNNFITFNVKRQSIGEDLVTALLTDRPREVLPTVNPARASVRGSGPKPRTTTIESSKADAKVLTIDKNAPLYVRGLPPLYLVYEAGGVSLYYAHISTEAVNSVKIAVKVSKE